LTDLAEALRDVSAGIAGLKSRSIGLSQALPKTPALEVVPLRGRIRIEAGGAGLSRLRTASFDVAIYVPLSPNLETDERALRPLLEAYLNAFEAGDATLGGLVEQARATEYEFGVARRGERDYRYASLLVIAGDLDEEGA